MNSPKRITVSNRAFFHFPPPNNNTFPFTIPTEHNKQSAPFHRIRHRILKGNLLNKITSRSHSPVFPELAIQIYYPQTRSNISTNKRARARRGMRTTRNVHCPKVPSVGGDGERCREERRKEKEKKRFCVSQFVTSRRCTTLIIRSFPRVHVISGRKIAPAQYRGSFKGSLYIREKSMILIVIVGTPVYLREKEGRRSRRTVRKTTLIGISTVHC